MAFATVARNNAVDGIASAATYVSLHTAAPGTTGASEVAGGTYARVQTTWAAAVSGSRTGSLVTINVPAGTTITHYGVWSADSGGTFHFGGPLPDPEAYGGPGVYGLTLTLAVSARLALGARRQGVRPRRPVS